MIIFKTPKLSIILATYNRAHLLSKAIESVLRQSFSGWELIIVDDCSTDNTTAIVQEWLKKDSRIIYSRGEKNMGIACNSNRGLRLARGEYVAIIDDDDQWIDSHKIKKQIEFLDKNLDYMAVGGGMIVIGKDGQEITRYFKPETDAQIKSKLLFDNTMANSTTVFRKSVAEAVGFYDESLRYSADRDFFLKLGLRGKLYNFQEYFAYYLLGGQNVSMVKMREHLKSSLIVMRRYKSNYPNYRLALAMNRLQYGYAFLPNFLKYILHFTLFKLKRMMFK